VSETADGRFNLADCFTLDTKVRGGEGGVADRQARRGCLSSCQIHLQQYAPGRTNPDIAELSKLHLPAQCHVTNAAGFGQLVADLLCVVGPVWPEPLRGQSC
jgi:hypothetical protein